MTTHLGIIIWSKITLFALPIGPTLLLVTPGGQPLHKARVGTMNIRLLLSSRLPRPTCTPRTVPAPVRTLAFEISTDLNFLVLTPNAHLEHGRCLLPLLRSYLLGGVPSLIILARLEELAIIRLNTSLGTFAQETETCVLPIGNVPIEDAIPIRSRL